MGLPTVQLVPRGRRVVLPGDLSAFLAARRRVRGQELNNLVDETARALGLTK